MQCLGPSAPAGDSHLRYEGYFLFFSILSVFVWLVIWRYLPETAGRSLEEMAALFELQAGGEAPKEPELGEVANPMSAVRVAEEEAAGN